MCWEDLWAPIVSVVVLLWKCEWEQPASHWGDIETSMQHPGSFTQMDREDTGYMSGPCMCENHSAGNPPKLLVSRLVQPS